MPTIKRLNVCLGIDPGFSGGIAVLSGKVIVSCKPMPEDLHAIYLALNNINNFHDIERCCIEWINPGIPGIGKSSMAKLYGNYQAVQMACVALGIPFELVQPKRWQSTLGIEARKNGESTDKWKGRLATVAKNKFPTLAVWKDTKKVQRCVADAILIALYAKRLA